MELLTDELRKQLPLLGVTEGQKDPMVICKFFTPWTGWTLYIMEFDGNDTFFGLVDSHEVELGYSSLSEIESIKGPFGLTVERDLHFEPTPLSIIRSHIERR
jgi:hypothetical protein